MLKFSNKCFFYNVLNVNSLECVLMSNQKYEIRSEIINVNTSVLSL